MQLIFGIELGRKKPVVEWSPDARQAFQAIAEDLKGVKGVRVGLDLKRPTIMSGRRIALAGHRDGIAVTLHGDERSSALQQPGAHLLEGRDGRVVKGMVALPWSAHEAWAGFAKAAVEQTAS